MKGLMQESQLTLDVLFRRAEQLFPDKEIITADAAGGRERTTYASWCDRTRRLAGVLDELGVSADGRVGTFGWNTARHLELYFAAPCSGRVLHTLNIRLFPEQLTYIANHAEDEVVFVDRSLLPLFQKVADTFTTVKHVVVMDDGAPNDVPDGWHDYEELLAASTEPVDFHVEDEWSAAAMCYTSGTTGNPKGVVYSHRSTVLHSMGVMTADSVAVSERDVILPVVPQFHANAWGLCQAGVFAGSSFVMPGPDLSPVGLATLIEEEKVTLAAGVPTIWMGLLPELSGRDVSSLTRVVAGGSAVPRALSEGFREAIGQPIMQAWGMTETSPVASTGQLRSSLDHLPEDEKADIRAMQGMPMPLVEARIVEPETTNAIAWDGEISGELQVRGPWIAATYYDDPRSPESFTDDGWLKTGDVATIRPDGYIRLVDRTKDLVKSGGEWISSVDIENELMAHPDIAEAAVIGIAHPKWVERPLACVVVAEGSTLTKDDVLTFLEPRVAKWWLPDDVVFIEEVPKTSVGKFSKKTLREQFEDYELPDAEGK
jgi:fatty-acyl-CoA synthase